MTIVTLHRFSRLPRQFFTALGLGVSLLVAGAIAPPPSPTQDTTPGVRPVDTDYDGLSAGLSATRALWETGTAAPETPNTETILLYTPAADCETFQSEERSVSVDKAIPQIVHLLLAEQTAQLLEFELAGYRIQQDSSGNTVTIDFRRTPGAQRHFVSLSICEQRVLFGSLIKTLTENPQLNIDAVRFTERGRPIQI